MWEKEKWEGHGRDKKRYINREVSPKKGRKVLFSPGTVYNFKYFLFGYYSETMGWTYKILKYVLPRSTA